MSRDEKFATAVEALHDAFLTVRQLSGDTTDAVLHAPSATTYLFPDVQAELRRMERAARQDAAERAAILNALPAQLAILDETGTIISVNDAWRAFADAQNYSDTSAGIGLNYLEVCRATTGDDREFAHAVARGLDEVLAGRSDGVNLDYPCHTPEELFWFNVMIAPMRGAARRGALVMHVDITEKHAADAREAELRGRIERLMNEAGIGILVHRDFFPVFVNPALGAMLGLQDHTEILRLRDIRPLLDVPHGRLGTDPGATAKPSAQVNFPDRISATRQDGIPVTFEIKVFPITWGEEAATCAMFTDITEKLRIEEQLRAVQRLEAIGQLTGGIAHDFNNLLTVILGSSDMLVEALEHQPELETLAAQIVTMAERGADLTKSLLAFGRRQPLNPQRTDVNAQLVALDALLRRTLRADIEICLALCEALWPAMVDPGEFDSAILNLALNARDAMRDGGKLTISTDNVSLEPDSPDIGDDLIPGTYVLVTVADIGCGMTEATLSRAFEPYFTTKGVGKGSGIGLSMVYGFVKQSKGHITIQSEPDEGTTIQMYFPRFVGDHSATTPVAMDRQSLPGQETILIVEDDLLILKQLRAQLEQLGYRVFAASEGEPALAILRDKTDIDLLLCDVVLPGGMNGQQISEAARQIRPGIKVLFTSGYAESTIVHQGRLDPGVELLCKPYRRSELAARIRKILDV